MKCPMRREGQDVVCNYSSRSQFHQKYVVCPRPSADTSMDTQSNDIFKTSFAHEVESDQLPTVSDRAVLELVWLTLSYLIWWKYRASRRSIRLSFPGLLCHRCTGHEVCTGLEHGVSAGLRSTYLASCVIACHNDH